MSAIMKAAWKQYRDTHKGCDKFYRKEFAICLRAAWATRVTRYAEFDMRPAFERGHMYQGIA